MRSALLLAIATMLIHASNAQAQFANHPDDGWHVCGYEDAPVCNHFILAHLIEPGNPSPAPNSRPPITPENCESGLLTRGTDYTCHVIPEPLSGEELRRAFPDDGRDILGLTFPEEPSLEKKCDTHFCDGGDVTPWRENWWSKNHSRAPGQDEDRGRGNQDVASSEPDRPEPQPTEPPASRPDRPEPAPADPPANCPGGVD